MGTVVNNEALEMVDALRARGATRIAIADVAGTRVEVEFPAEAPLVVATKANAGLEAQVPWGATKAPAPKAKPKSELEEAAEYERTLLGSARP